MLSEKTFDTGAVALNYAEGPHSGPPCLLLSGFTRRWQDLFPIMPVIAEDWHLFTLDYRGHGKSGRTPGAYRFRDYVEDLECFIKEVIAEPVVILGNSLGGLFALALAESLPELVSAIIVGDVNLDHQIHTRLLGSETWRSYFIGLGALAGHKSAEDEALRQIDPEAVQYHVQGNIAGFYDGATNVDLRRITCPTLLLQGDPNLGGMLTSLEIEHALSVMPAAKHVMLNNTGHDLGFETRDLSPYMDAVLSFLGEMLRTIAKEESLPG